MTKFNKIDQELIVLLSTLELAVKYQPSNKLGKLLDEVIGKDDIAALSNQELLDRTKRWMKTNGKLA